MAIGKSWAWSQPAAAACAEISRYRGLAVDVRMGEIADRSHHWTVRHKESHKESHKEPLEISRNPRNFLSVFLESREISNP
jgi:hypothetical protein